MTWMVDCDFRYTSLKRSKFIGVDFNNCELSGCSIKGMTIDGIDVEEALSFYRNNK